MDKPNEHRRDLCCCCSVDVTAEPASLFPVFMLSSNNWFLALYTDTDIRVMSIISSQQSISFASEGADPFSSPLPLVQQIHS